ncbi:tyrosine-type recombinase/integrase [Kitasatospora purpeofusca]|uniref:tyrosine-type recombinase/integrase n=1 Tax=Kitasatospora purpeofusca TaxID=67352 RepID=UPI00225C22E2|nr:site-specific integrase [Kitasatospora purpeofusca]MCX4758812.1 site-specific integrase [Kitasatospora purpeofusca]WSR30761.1 site-specific integrase [Kitasatospora purpeofusca]
MPTVAHGIGSRWEVRGWNNAGVALPKKRFEDKGEAERHAAAITNDLAEGDYVDPRDSRTTVKAWASEWLSVQGGDESTAENRERYVRIHIIPGMGDFELGEVERRPSIVQAFLKQLEAKGISIGYRYNLFIALSSIFSAAVEDRLIKRNPCQSRSVKKPKIPPRQLVPWEFHRVHSVILGLPEGFRAAGWIGFGAGLRQGEIFGIAESDIDFRRRIIRIRQQVKLLGTGAKVFALPKGGKTREVPMDDVLAEKLAQHIADFPPVRVALPWATAAAKAKSFRLLFTDLDGGALHRSRFNLTVWKPALVTAGVIPPPIRAQKFEASPEDGMHALRHAFAAALVDGGCSIKDLAAYLGHADEAFTLRTYVHLMPKSDERARAAISRALFAADVPAPGGDLTAV